MKKERKGEVITGTIRVNSDIVRMIFKPKEDITAYELALCIPYLREQMIMKVFLPDDKIIRHFEVIDL